MLKRLTLILTFILLIFSLSQAEPDARPNRPNFSVIGTVLESDFNLPIEYATIVLYSLKDSSQTDGTITNADGIFEVSGLKPGRYWAEVSFLGYQTEIVEGIKLGRGQFQYDMGKILIKPKALEMEDVELVIERSPVEFHIDKRVINVSKQATSASGTAIEVLEKVPSVTVDIEGNVSLRGSANFKVLIDGRPTILDPSDALQQVPASSIENIEIITNPSAKYEPDGNSGIINIILKQNKLNGTAGMVSVSYGDTDRNSADALISHKFGKYGISIGANYRNNVHEMDSESENWTRSNGITSYYNSNGTNDHGRNMYGFRIALDINITPKDLLSFGTRFGYHEMEHNGDLEYEEWTDLDTTPLYYSDISTSTRSGNFFMAYAEYIKKFKTDGHELTFRVSSGGRDGDEESSNQHYDVNNVLIEGTKTTENGPGRRSDIKLDYVLPTGEESKLEAGYQTRIGLSKDETELFVFDPVTADYEFQSDYAHSIDYHRNIHALYSTFSSKFGELGYQMGLRGEYTDRKIEVAETGEEFTIDRMDLYPTVHFSYQLPAEQQLITSYTRRIHRPRGWELEPFETWTDAYNVRVGNPDLEPEHINSYELGYQKTFKNFQFSLEGYHRATENRVERVKSTYIDENGVTLPGVILSSVDNVGTEYASGTEIMLEGNVVKMWNANLMVNLFNQRVKGQLNNVDFDNEDFSWNLRFNNTFKLPHSWRIQITEMYNSKRVTAQGEFADFLVTDIAVQKEFWNRKLTAILQVNDVFSTAGHEFTSYGTDFYNYSNFEREAPLINFTLKFNINNYRPERKQNNSNGSSMSSEDDDF